MLLSSAVVFGSRGLWEVEANEGTTVWYLVAVAYRGSSSSSSNTGLAAVACRGSSSDSSNELAAVVFLISIDVAPMLFLRPGRRDSNNRRTRGTTAATVQRRSSSQAPVPSLALAGIRGTTAAPVQCHSSSQAPTPSVALAGSRGTLAKVDLR